MVTKPINHLDGLQPYPPRQTMTIMIACVAVIGAGIVWLCSALHPLPPRTITMATGPAGSSFETFGKRYQQLLAKDGIKVILLPTAGGVENLARLRDPKSKVDVGFVEGGIASEDDSPELASLGTLCYEPIWFFAHKPETDRGLFSMPGEKVSVGPEGSASRALLDELIKHKALNTGSAQLLDLSPDDSASQLINGQIDEVILMSSLASPVVRQLITAKGVYLANFTRANAYVARFPSLYKLVVSEGAGDLEKNSPPHDTTLLATKTSLIVRGDLNPAIQYMLLETASLVHYRAGILQQAGEFPAAEALEIPLSSDARSYYKSGKPFLQRYLPFWLAALVEQLGFLAVPVIGLLYPLVKFLMWLYGWGMQRKIYIIYGELHWLEREMDKLGNQPPPPEMLAHMKRLETRAHRIKVSPKYIPMLYSLKETLVMVRARLDSLSHQ